jgi:uncharacterized protein YcgL (UPF0745 family)
MGSCSTGRTEHEEQCAVFEWAGLMSNQFPELELMFAVPNGGVRPHKFSGSSKKGDRYSVEGRKLKKEGVKKGVPDIFLPVPKGVYHGLFIEMKRRRGFSVKADQEAWLKNLAHQGYFVVVCKGSDAALKVLRGYLALQKHESLTF